MDDIFMIVYIVVNIFMICVNAFVAYRSYAQKVERGKYLCFTALACIWIQITYFISVVTYSHSLVSFMSSLCFIGFDWLSVFLMEYVLAYTRYHKWTMHRPLKIIAYAYAIIDTMIYLLNPFCEIAVGYIERDTYIAHFVYDKYLLYHIHLVFTYIMVGIALILLVMKMTRTPAPYKNQYTYSVLCIVSVVVINALFLFIKVDSAFVMLDYSTLLYGIALLIFYWSCFNYTVHEMLKNLTLKIFENIDQGIVLFDYTGELVQKNARAEALLHLPLKKEMHFEDFLAECNISQDVLTRETATIQCFREADDKIYPLRCDYRCLMNQRGKEVGFLYVFTDAQLETDFMTGFQNVESFLRYINTRPELFEDHAGVAVFDINNLSMLNSSYGKAFGDKKLRELAETIRTCFPEDTFFVRGNDAHLFAICLENSELAMDAYAKLVQDGYDGNFQYAVAMVGAEQNDMMGAMSRAIKSMKNKKLLDKASAHSQTLNSLVQALRESDADTEAHVQRTQQMGWALGKRIGLTDMDLSNLSLLCLLHDIGKIGIPLDILNKPGKLSKEEWTVLQSHVEKGYQIANSSTELSGIAEMILRHHERWDGQGYPGGLSRETIPLLSRIIAVVDAYDAMVNNRPYRKCMSVENAILELRNCAGSQFDPHIVAEFIEMLKTNEAFTGGYQIDNSILESKENESLAEQQALNAEQHVSENANSHLVPYSTYLLDKNDYIIKVDDHFEEMTGYTQDDVLDLQLKQKDLIPEDDRTDYLLLISETLSQSNQVYLEHPLLRKDGSLTYVFCYGKVYYDSAVQEYRSEIAIANSANTYSVKLLLEAESNRAKNQLKHWEKTYRRDSLTGLYNHNAFQNDVELKLLQNDARIVLLMMDVDKFKNYNDTYGHSEGDDFLIFVANALKNALRKDDLACRMGGDEFSAALSFGRNVTEEDIRKRIYQIFDMLSRSISSKGRGVSLSMGAAIAQPGETFNSFYKRADVALYKSKDNGRARLSFAEEAE